MKVFKKIAATVLGAAMCASLGLRTAFAEEQIDTSNVSSVSSSDTLSVEKLEHLKQLNPNITDEQWEMVEGIRNPETNSLVMVGQTKRVDNGQLIINSIYSDEAVPYVSGQRKYYAFGRIFEGETTASELLATTYLSAEISYVSKINERKVEVDESTINTLWLSETGSNYPEYVWDDDSPHYDRLPDGTIYGGVVYDLKLRIRPDFSKVFVTAMFVDEYGNQIYGELTDFYYPYN